MTRTALAFHFSSRLWIAFRSALVNAEGHRTSFSYDAAGYEVGITNPLNQIVTSGYDAAGRKTLRVDARTNRTTYTFDANARETGRRYPDGTRVTTSYDAAGNRILVVDATGRYTRTYDPRNLTTTSTNPQDKTLTFTWDAVRERDHMIEPDGGRVTCTHDAANRLTLLVNAQGERTSYVYDAAGRQVTRQLDNGTWTSFTYDVAGRTTQVSHLDSSNAVFSSFEYGYDNTTNRTSILEHAGDRVTCSAQRFVKSPRMLTLRDHSCGSSVLLRLASKRFNVKRATPTLQRATHARR